MARSGAEDPILKFRFKVTVIAIDVSVSSAVQTVSAAVAAAGNNGTLSKVAQKFTVLTRAGFSEVTLPKANINTMNYRENIDNLRFSKSPGLVKFEPIVLRRGATDNRDLFNWYRQVNDDALLTGAAQELGIGSTAPPSMSEHFRNEVIIEALDREGNSVKQWMLFNAWPNSYKGGNDLNSATDETLIEEIGLEYEYFLELKGGLSGLTDLLADAAQAGIAYAASKNNIPFLQ
jgi:phage tail-like protein